VCSHVPVAHHVVDTIRFQLDRWPNLSSAPQFALLRNAFLLLAQISDPIFKLAVVVALWKARDNHVDAGRGILAPPGWPISHHLADAEFVGCHRLDFCTPR
jgi:hypothetical protein